MHSEGFFNKKRACKHRKTIIDTPQQNTSQSHASIIGGKSRKNKNGVRSTHHSFREGKRWRIGNKKINSRNRKERLPES